MARDRNPGGKRRGPVNTGTKVHPNITAEDIAALKADREATVEQDETVVEFTPSAQLDATLTDDTATEQESVNDEEPTRETPVEDDDADDGDNDEDDVKSTPGAKGKKRAIKDVMVEGITAGKSTEDILEDIYNEFPHANSGPKDVSWYRWKLAKAGTIVRQERPKLSAEERKAKKGEYEKAYRARQQKEREARRQEAEAKRKKEEDDRIEEEVQRRLAERMKVAA